MLKNIIFLNIRKKARLDESIKAIVIVPTSLLYNWKKEFLKFSYIQPIIVDGAQKDREKTIKNFKEGILITKGTIEEKILKIQEQKKLLSETLIEKKVGEKTLFELSDSELLDLINKN